MARLICPICGGELQIESHHKALVSLPNTESYHALCPNPECATYEVIVFAKTIPYLKYYPETKQPMSEVIK